MAQATWEQAIVGGELGAGSRRMASPLHVTFAPVEPAAGSAPTLTAAVAWALPGFLIGTVFWHFVGFWGFVSHVVLGVPGEQAEPAPPVAIVRPSELSENWGWSLSSAEATDSSACIALALDRVTGTTRLKACDASAIASPHGAPAGKEDLAFLRRSPTSAPPLISRGDATAQSGGP